MVHCGIIMIKQLDLLTRKNHDAQIILDSIRSNTIAFCPVSKLIDASFLFWNPGALQSLSSNREHGTSATFELSRFSNHTGAIDEGRCHDSLRNHRETVQKEKSLSSFVWNDKGCYLRFPRPWQTRAHTQIFRRSFTLSSPLYLSRKSTPTIWAARVRVQRHDWSFFVRLFAVRGSHILTDVASVLVNRWNNDHVTEKVSNSFVLCHIPIRSLKFESHDCICVFLWYIFLILVKEYS